MVAYVFSYRHRREGPAMNDTGAGEMHVVPLSARFEPRAWADATLACWNSTGIKLKSLDQFRDKTGPPVPPPPPGDPVPDISALFLTR